MPLCVPVLHAPISSAAYSRYVQCVYTKGLCLQHLVQHMSGLCDLMHMCMCVFALLQQETGNDGLQQKICLNENSGGHAWGNAHSDVHKRRRSFAPILLHSVPLCTGFRCQI